VGAGVAVAEGLADDATAVGGATALGGDAAGGTGSLVPPIARPPRATTEARAMAAATTSTATDATIGIEARAPRLAAGTFRAASSARR
jgi:hypothetical protein